jgi:two-component system sensor histidine kinase RegB
VSNDREEIYLAPARNNLQRLVLLRYVLVIATGLGLGAAHYWGTPLGPIGPVVWVGATLLLLNVATQLRLRSNASIGDVELFLQLLADVGWLSILLAWSGAPHSPLGSLFLLPVVIAAVTLERRMTWCIGLLSIACYTYLYYRYSVAGQELGHSETFDIHVLGMWATFVFSALLIAFFLQRMASAIRDRDRLLAAKREEALRDEHIVALGTMAVGAAHELGTPLTTMAVIAGDLQQECSERPELVADIVTLRSQITHCKKIITELLASAGHARAEAGGYLPLDEYLDEIMAKWQLVRPSVVFAYERRGMAPTPAVIAEQTVGQAIMNLLNNAADASPDHVEVEGEWSEESLRLEIRDRGPGLTRAAKARAGEPFFSTKPPGEGIGIGLFLANATVERFGGKVGIFNREGGGVCTLVEIPLRQLRPGAAA